MRNDKLGCRLIETGSASPGVRSTSITDDVCGPGADMSIDREMWKEEA